MMESEAMDTKTLFSMKAERYAKYRWNYANSAIETVINITQMSAHSTLADIGAGTGILTKHFIDRAQLS
jgi:16S rRNA A1518/A1519 N6-dimethyltransferase RsmA/KsgA/DIM1 with predicted DNA glycosylase/AP lyase activity